MRILHATLLVILAAGCTAPEDPVQELPVANPDPSATAEILPVDPQPAAEPRLDPVTALKRLDAVLETDDEGNVLSLTASGPLIVSGAYHDHIKATHNPGGGSLNWFRQRYSESFNIKKIKLHG